MVTGPTLGEVRRGCTGAPRRLSHTNRIDD